MKNVSFATRFCRKCLYSSLSVADMVRFVQMVYPDYDIYKSSGYPAGHPIPNQDAATRIVSDMVQEGLYVDFVEHLITVNADGYMGRRYDLRGLDDIIGDIIQAGFNYDKTTGQFFENQRERISRNWGRLMDGDERKMAVLRLDIAGNSILVKENPRNLIEKAYGDLRAIVTKAVVSRLGRLWSWEGDGALGVFMLGNYSRVAIFAGIEILNEMFLYNKLQNPLNSEIKIRLSVHSGNLIYYQSETECLKHDTVKKAVSLESKAAPNSVVISGSLAVTQDQAVLNIFSNEKITSGEKYRLYQLSQEHS
jgi:class 3 adenylate cyclase